MTATSAHYGGARVLLDACRLSLGTLTVIPVKAPSRIDRRVAGLAMLLAPLAVVPIAVLWLVLALLGASGIPAAVPAVVALITVALYTRGMHLDGLADLADGLSASYDRQRALDVMKTGDVGPSGVAAITLTLLLQAAATHTIMVTGTTGRLSILPLGVMALFASRLSLAVACRRGVPAARPNGLGSAVAGSVSPLSIAGATLLLIGVGTPVVMLSTGHWWMVPAVVLGTLACALIVVRHAQSRLGGITGDVLGAVVEITYATGLSIAAVVAVAASLL